jgi:hypothetical protein
MTKQKKFLLLAIFAGIAGVIIGGVMIYFLITDIAKP